MLKKTVTYQNFDDEEVSETFYFHMSQAELLRWEAQLQNSGGLKAYFEETMESKDGAKIMAFMEDFIARSIGRKSPDGSRFEKGVSITEDFKTSLAYDTFFMEMVTNPEAAAEFLNGIIPKELADNVNRMTEAQRVQANVEARQTRNMPVDDIDELEEPGQPEPTEPVSDPSQGGNVFAPEQQKARTITQAEMREMDHTELVEGLANGTLVIDRELS